MTTETGTGHHHSGQGEVDHNSGHHTAGDRHHESTLTPSALAARQAELVAGLLGILPAAQVLHETEDLRPYECDGLSAYRQLPLAVALPDTADQVQAILKLCHRLGVPVVARGAGTGLSAGALPHLEGLLLSLARLKAILHIDPLARTARVQPGVRNLAISEAARPYGLYYAPDPSSQIACTIGGNVAENSGGVHCLKYGLTVHNLLRLEVITMEGERLVLGAEALDAPGYDLMALMTGSEGLLGVVVAITVRLLPLPERAQVLLAAYDDIGQAGAAVGAIIAAGIIPAGLEMMDNPAIRAAEAFVHAGYPMAAAAILLCELDGANEEVSQEILRVRQILLDSGATEVRTARDEAERLLFWKGRKAAFPAVGRLSPDYYCMDGTIPRRRLPEVLARIAEMSASYGLPVANVFHAGDGNMHPLILYDANRPGDLERCEAMGAEILRLCVEVGGCLTGEHGVGIEKRDLMGVQYAEADMEAQMRVKHVFDPAWLLNPAKVFPLAVSAARRAG